MLRCRGSAPESQTDFVGRLCQTPIKGGSQKRPTNHMLHCMDLKTPRVISLVHSDNAPSSRVAEKIGMTVEKQITFRGFRTKVFSLSRDRWLALSGV